MIKIFDIINKSPKNIHLIATSRTIEKLGNELDRE
jgi:hypothetical protein